MKIAVLMKDVPDLVEELEIEDGVLAVDDMSFVPSEWDDQALEEALLIKEEQGAEVIAVAVDTGDVDTLLYTALAKGADQAVKIVGDFDRTLSNRERASLLAAFCRDESPDLVLTGVQAIDDLDGQIAGLVAGLLAIAHASVVRDVHVANGRVQFIQEYSGGRMAEFSASTPALLGIQAARKPPRYVTVAKVRQVQKSAQLREVDGASAAVPSLTVRRVYKPEAAGHAQMWGDDVDEVAENIIRVLEDKKLLRG
ncbi:electron transfer flavoprotein subunit beta/FixA family protein [Sulfobacillus harzensis]|uniref:Electron transfer flavoprotein subunit beta n=1 Tax=Sulfobacillus harzensis TaxID=2729629 RepID=A0A7Y0Q1X4_9FIRM|nr:electron transfer flavoprotein subunit beta [Sulfobacillus harzensis]NMP21902.1 electron transfer flavoprotein subunit beta [Sulfobacillus harzensis]